MPDQLERTEYRVVGERIAIRADEVRAGDSLIHGRLARPISLATSGPCSTYLVEAATRRTHSVRRDRLVTVTRTPWEDVTDD